MSPERPIRVCHIVSDDGWGGAESVIRGLLQAQSISEDVEPSLVSLNEGRLVAFARESGIPVRVVPESGRGFLALLSAVAPEIEALRPAVLHSHRYKENFLAWLVAPRCGARSVVTLHGDEPLATWRGRLAVRLRRAVARRLAERAGAHFAAVARDLPPLLGLSGSQWVQIPNGITLPPLAKKPGEERPGGSTPTVGWVGRMVPVKGLPLLLEALALLPKPLADARLLLVGDGPERAALEAHAARLGLSHRVEFRGFVADPAPERARMDVFALPSLYEGIPLALLEAMGAGLPCVAAAVGGIPDAVGASGAVRLVPSREAKDWASALAELLVRTEEAHALGTRARAYVAANLSGEAVARAYRALYCDVLSGSISR